MTMHAEALNSGRPSTRKNPANNRRCRHFELVGKNYRRKSLDAPPPAPQPAVNQKLYCGRTYLCQE